LACARGGRTLTSDAPRSHVLHVLAHRQPTAIIVVSAHWEESVPTVQSGDHPEMLFDYYGFPDKAYEIKYPAPGAPVLASRVTELMGKAGFAPEADRARGFDHGVFIPLMLMFPAADIPVFQLSMLASLNAAEHVRMGQALQPLREEGVLILGSGMQSFHNMGGFFGRSNFDVGKVSKDFDAWLTGVVTSKNTAWRDGQLAAWAKVAPQARDAHPREEHLLPAMVCAGAAGTDVGEVIFETTLLGTSASVYRFRRVTAGRGRR